MTQKIQRVPRGLNELLSLSGGATPILLQDEVRATLDLLQFYGAQQLQTVFANNAALAEGGTGVPATLSATNWTVLFGLSGQVVKTATATALRARLTLNRRVQTPLPLFAEELGPFGATETGTCNFGGLLAYPILCPPGTVVACALDVLGTDATANVSVTAEFGVVS